MPRRAPDPRVPAPAPRADFRLPPPGWPGMAQRERGILLAHVRELLSRPTAPYVEHAQLAYVREAARRIGIPCRSDRFGNLLVGEAQQAGSSLAFSAHLDHPGLVFLGRRGGEPVAELLGGVPLRAAAPLAARSGAPVRFFARGSAQVRATGRIARLIRAARPGAPPLAVLAELRGAPRAGDPGMWDLTPGRIGRGGRLAARACDDLLGAAAILTVLEILALRGERRRTFGIFTRAEETGFIGCLGLLRSGELPQGAQVIGLECSPRRATARVGAGPVIRVGDAASVFDPQLTLLLESAAERLRSAAGDFRFQRALMDGGRCESTAYNAFGVRAGGLCLALANYHNHGPRQRIAPELVDWYDLEGLVLLMLETARAFGTRRPDPIRARLDALWKSERARLAPRVAGEPR